MSKKSTKNTNKRDRPLCTFLENHKNNKLLKSNDINSLEDLSLDEEGNIFVELINHYFMV